MCISRRSWPRLGLSDVISTQVRDRARVAHRAGFAHARRQRFVGWCRWVRPTKSQYSSDGDGRLPIIQDRDHEELRHDGVARASVKLQAPFNLRCFVVGAR